MVVTLKLVAWGAVQFGLGTRVVDSRRKKQGQQRQTEQPDTAIPQVHGDILSLDL